MPASDLKSEILSVEVLAVFIMTQLSSSSSCC